MIVYFWNVNMKMYKLRSDIMSKQTALDVIDAGINKLLNDYDNWEVKSIINKHNDLFPNNLHWQYGHILTVFESIFSLINQNELDIEKYNTLFGNGTNPSNWKGQDIPEIEKIIEEIKRLPQRARELTNDQLETKLEHPIANIQTVDELLVLNAMHIPLHAGKIEEMTRVLKLQ